MQAPDSIGSAYPEAGAAGLGQVPVRFVLVEPTHCGNIGASARAIRTMGFGALSVVAPRDRDYRTSAEAVALAAHATGVLQHSQSCPTVVEALQGVSLAFAMTGYARQFGPPHRLLRDAAQQAAQWLQQDRGAVAFVFGTERSGLVNDDVLRCHYSCAIPADPRSGSLNLAQAVQVAAYEMRLALSGPQQAQPAPPGGATVDMIERLVASFERALTVIGFLDPLHPKHSMARLRSLLARAGLSAAEVDFLQGVCAAVVEPKRLRAGRKRPPAPAGGRFKPD
jgi:tRNA/rRNA methyltransferase